MNNEEAIEILCRWSNLGYGIILEGDTAEIEKALDMAIEALEKADERH